MDVSFLHSSNEYIGNSGRIFSNEQCIMLQNSLTVLQKENKLHKIFLWGQIHGIENDYVISFGYRKDALRDIVYYYSTDYINWGLMPTGISSNHISLTEMCHTRFQGDPKYTINIFKEEPVKDTQVNETANPILDETKTLKEEDRLAATVKLITKDAAVVPRGALFKRTDGTIIQNGMFEGLKLEEIVELKSYLHFREPEHKWNTNLLTRHDYNYALDFLDTIDMDTPEGKWSLRFNEAQKLALLRNLEWPGMAFYHKINTPQHWFIYFGNGKRNLDIPFMI